MIFVSLDGRLSVDVPIYQGSRSVTPLPISDKYLPQKRNASHELNSIKYHSHTFNRDHQNMTSLLDITAFSYIIHEFIRELEGRNEDVTRKSWCEVLSNKDAKSIPQFIFRGGRRSEEDEDQTCCAICRRDFIMGDVISSLPTCHHLFHKKCVYRWLTRYRRCCPLCMMYIKA